MFGDLMGMMGKLKEAQKRVEIAKKRLDTVLLEEASSDGNLKVTITGNRKITALHIDDGLLGDKEQLQDYLVETLNKAIEKANGVNQTEMSAAAKEGLPNIPGVDSFFKP